MMLIKKIRISMVQLPPLKTQKYFFHVALTEKAQHCRVNFRVVFFDILLYNYA